MRSRLTGIVALCVAALTVGLLTPASADETEERKRQVDATADRLRGALAETTAQLADAVVSLQRAQAQLPGAEAEVARSRGRLAAAQARDAQIAAELAEAEADERRAVAELGRVAGEMGESEAALGRMARRAYQTGDVPQLAVVLDAESVDDFASRLVLAGSVLRSENAVLGRLANDRANVAAQGATLEAKREEIARLKAESAAQVREVEELTRSAEAARARVAGLIGEAAAATATIESQRADEERRLAEMAAESQRLQAILVERARRAKAEAEARARAEAAAAAKARAEQEARAERRAREDAEQRRREREQGRAASSRPSGASAGSGESRSRSSSGGSSSTESRSSSSGASAATTSASGFARPVNASISSIYGMRRHPITGVYKLHDGTDFGAGCGTPIRAAAAGEVIWASYRGGYGYQLAIDHGILGGENVVTSYSHMPAGGFRARPGERVARGEVVGAVGTTGMSTGCHLHFMMYEDGATVDPMSRL